MTRPKPEDPSPEAHASGVWPAWLVSPDRRIVAEMTELLAREAPTIQLVKTGGYPHPTRPFDPGTAPRVCFLDVCSAREEALALLGRFCQPSHHIPVVAILGEMNYELALRCIRNGASGCLVRPFDREQLLPVLLRLGCASAETKPVSKGRVLCVVPAKGSCGATTLALNLAFYGRRAGFKSVLLADMDPVAGTLSFVLKLKSQYSFADALSHAGSLDSDLWKGLVVPCRDIDVLLAPQDPLDSNVEAGGVGGLISYVKRAYEVVILDMGGLSGPIGLEMAKLSDEVVLVTTAELGAIYSAKRWLSHLGANGVSKSVIRLVVSRWKRHPGLGREEIEAVLGLKIYHILPHDLQPIQDALLEGRPVAPGSPYGKSMTELTGNLLEPSQPTRKSPPRAKLLSLFSKRA